MAELGPGGWLSAASGDQRAELLETLLTRAPAAIAHLDRDLTFRWVNEAFEALYARASRGVVGRGFDEVFPAAGGELRERLVEVATTGCTITARGLRFVFEGPEGLRTTYWDLTIAPTGLPDGGLLMTSTDVTDRVERELGQLRQIEAMRQAEAFSNEILGLVSHELRTPLHALMGFGRLLLGNPQDPLSEQQATYVQRMLDVSDSLARIVNDILEVSQLQSGTLSMAMGELDLARLARDVVNRLGPLARQQGLTLALDAPAEVIAHGDQPRTQQVLMNLVGNALKFTPAGGRVRIGVARVGDRARVEVEDTGPGIAGEHLPRLFVPFSQVDMSSTRTHRGSGLGLSIAKGLVEAQGGAIGVNTEPGNGSTFWFELPGG